MPNWKKVIVSGSDASLTSLSVTNNVTAQSFTGSLLGTASYATNALTASYAMNGGSGGLSALYIQDEGTTQGTASYIDFTGAGVTATVTNGTASITIPGGGGTGGSAQTFTQSSAATTWSFAHSVNSRTPIVEVYDSTYNVIIPTSIYNPGPYNTNIYFDVAQSGYAIISTGGILAVSGSNAVLNQNSSATTWSFNHNLHTTYPVFTIYDSNDDVIIPQRIHVVDTGSALIYFSTARTGKAIASVGGNINFTSESISSSFATTASYALNATSASYSLVATTASYILNAVSASYALTASYASNIPVTASFALSASNAISSSYAINAATASYLLNYIPPFPFTGSAGISGSLVVNGNITSTGTITAQTLVVQTVTSSIVYSSGSNIFGNNLANTQVLTGSVTITGSLAVNGSNVILTNQTSSMSVLSASYAATATSASYSVSSTSASYAVASTSASYSLNATSASYITGSNVIGIVSNAISASYALNGGVTQLLAGPNITLSPISGKGQVTISATGGSGSFFNTATGSYGSFYDTTTQTNPVANIPRSMSFNTTDITNGVSISGSTSPFNTYIKTENPGVYDIQFSAQIDKTDSGADEIVIWLAKNGTALTDTATTLTLTGNNDKQVAAWNWFVNSAANDYYQIIWYSADTDLRILAETAGGGHPGIPSVIATVNRVDQFLSNTGSFSGSFSGQFTGSLAGTSSYATSASYALTASYAANVPVTSSFAISASQAQNAVSASYALTSSYSLSGTGFPYSGSAVITGSLFVSGSGITGSLFGTSSYAINALTASFALTSPASTLQQVVNAGNGISNYGGNGSASIQSTNFTNNRTLYLNDNSFPTIRLVDNLNASNNLQIDIATLSLNGTSYNWSDIVSSTSSYALTASYATFAISASNAPGYTVQFTQSVSATTWSFTHNLNTRNPIVQVYDTNYKQIIPNDIVGTSVNTAEVRFDYAQAGYAVMSNGGGLYITGSTSELSQSSAAVTWSFTHNLNSKYINFTVYDSNDYVIIPAGIKALTTNTAELYFAYAQTGRAVAQFSGINGAPNATSASYALTATSASYALNTTTASYALTSSYLNPIVSSYVVLTQVSQSLNFADDTSAAAGGVPLGGLYRNGNFILIRIS